jgi:RecB family exonuclease
VAIKLSPLRVRVFDTCRLRYRYQYVDRIKSRLRIGDTAGSLVHRVLSDFFTKVAAAQRTPATLLGMFGRSWVALSPRYLQMAGVERLREDCRRQLERFAEEHDLSAKPFMVEAYFEVELEPGIVLFGRMDRIDAEPNCTLHIIDYKTGSQPDEIDPGQLWLYAILVEEKLARAVGKASFWFLDDGRTWTMDLAAGEKARVRQELLATVEEMQTVSEFPATIGPHCGHCPYLHACEHRAEILPRLESGDW